MDPAHPFQVPPYPDVQGQDREGIRWSAEGIRGQFRVEGIRGSFRDKMVR